MQRFARSALVPALLAAALAIAAGATAAEPSTAAETATPADSEVDEVVVRGKQLSQLIDEAEDEYFGLFNEVNKDDRYDTHCVYLQLESTSRMQSRACIPGFVADAMADWAPYKARCQPPQQGEGDEFDCLDRNHDGRISLAESAARPELEVQFDELNNNPPIDSYLSREEMLDDMPPLQQAVAVYMPPSPDLILMEGTKKWYEHMLKVTTSDPRLKKMADHLGDLYLELAATKQKFEKLEAETQPKAAKRRPIPRIR